LLCLLAVVKGQECSFPLSGIGQCIMTSTTANVKFEVDDTAKNLLAIVSLAYPPTATTTSHILLTYNTSSEFALVSPYTNSFVLTSNFNSSSSAMRFVVGKDVNLLLSFTCLLLVLLQGKFSERSFFLVAVVLLAAIPLVQMQDGVTGYDAAFRVTLPAGANPGFLVQAGSNFVVEVETSADTLDTVNCGSDCTAFGVPCDDGEWINGLVSPPACQTCTQPDNCVDASETYPCVDQYYYCTECNPGYYRLGGACLACNEPDNCQTYNEDATCVGNLSDDYVCTNPLGGFYLSDGVCFACSTNANCTASNTAAACNGPYYSCVTCAAGLTLSNGQCM